MSPLSMFSMASLRASQPSSPRQFPLQIENVKKTFLSISFRFLLILWQRDLFFPVVTYRLGPVSPCEVCPWRREPRPALLPLWSHQMTNSAPADSMADSRGERRYSADKECSTLHCKPTLRMGSPSLRTAARAMAPSDRTRQSPKLITWTFLRYFRAYVTKTPKYFQCSIVHQELS